MKNLLKHKGFYGTIEFSIEDEVLFGKILGIDGLVNYEGQTISELGAAFKEAVEDYLAVCVKAGIEPKKVYTGTFNIRVGKELHENLDIISKAKGISLNRLVKDQLSQLSSN